jgi:hypothetical protein
MDKKDDFISSIDKIKIKKSPPGLTMLDIIKG